MKIYKYPLKVTDEQTVRLPVDSEILCTQIQHGAPYIWALVNEESQLTEERTFITHGTGHQCSQKIGAYLGTYQLEGGAFVGHVFEKIVGELQ